MHLQGEKMEAWRAQASIWVMTDDQYFISQIYSRALILTSSPTRASIRAVNTNIQPWARLFIKQIQQAPIIVSIDFAIMSFDKFEKIINSRRDSPNVFEGFALGSHSRFIHQPRSTLHQGNSTLRGLRAIGEGKPAEVKINKKPMGEMFGSETQRISPLIGNFLHILPEARLNKSHNRNLSQRTRKNNNSSTETSQALQQRQKLSNYVMIFPVGKGGFGKVWKVKDKRTAKIFALKEMKKVKIVSKRSVHSVMNERKLLATLKSDFLVNMQAAFQDKENLYLILDYCSRGDMRYHMSTNGKFTEAQVKFFLACVILCLEYLHRRGIIHRDLKPENLVFDHDGYVRVTDLGVSRMVQAQNAKDTSGTPGYMAPQVITKNNHSYPVDYFAIGVMGFELMTGKRPYLGANRNEIRENMLAKQQKLINAPKGWSNESVDFVNNLIQRKPSCRLGCNGVQEVKEHPWFDGFDWESLFYRKIASPFVPLTIEQDYSNYQICISEDTEVDDMEQYRLILRHPDTQEAFIGYEFDRNHKTQIRMNEKKETVQGFLKKTMMGKRSFQT